MYLLLLDLVLYNSAGDSFDPKSPVNAVLTYTGEVIYLPPGMFRSTCQIEIDQFPFDEQKCRLKFGRFNLRFNKKKKFSYNYLKYFKKLDVRYHNS